MLKIKDLGREGGGFIRDCMRYSARDAVSRRSDDGRPLLITDGLRPIAMGTGRRCAIRPQGRGDGAIQVSFMVSSPHKFARIETSPDRESFHRKRKEDKES